MLKITAYFVEILYEAIYTNLKHGGSKNILSNICTTALIKFCNFTFLAKVHNPLRHHASEVREITSKLRVQLIL